jgi:hypothetical protein
MIIEYMLEQVGDSFSMKAPGFVGDGGYWDDPDSFTYVGWAPPLAEREFYLPESILVLDKASFIARALDLHGRYPMQDYESDLENPTTLTTEQVTAQASSWWDYKVDEHLNKPISITTELEGEDSYIVVTFAKKGIIVMGTPTLTVLSGEASIAATLVSKSYNSLTFRAPNVSTIELPANSSIELNGGSITDGEVALPLYLGDL